MAAEITISNGKVALDVFSITEPERYVTQSMTVEEAFSLAQRIHDMAVKLSIQEKCKYGSREDVWVPANGGSETPFLSRSGRRLLYCWNPGKGKHAYLDLGTDTILSDEEAARYMETV